MHRSSTQVQNRYSTRTVAKSTKRKIPRAKRAKLPFFIVLKGAHLRHSCRPRRRYCFGSLLSVYNISMYVDRVKVIRLQMCQLSMTRTIAFVFFVLGGSCNN